jgi:hypothetical protein
LEEAFAIWHSTITTELLFASYIEFAKSRGERRILTREGLGRFFASLGAETDRWRNGTVAEHLADVETLNGVTRKAKVVKAKRAYGYKLGDLTKARDDFTHCTGLAVEWESGTDPADDGADDD